MLGKAVLARLRYGVEVVPNSSNIRIHMILFPKEKIDEFEKTKIIIEKGTHTVMILSFRTDMPGQTVQTQIRLIRVYTVCHSVCIVWTHYSIVEPHSSNFRVITTNFWVSE